MTKFKKVNDLLDKVDEIANEIHTYKENNKLSVQPSLLKNVTMKKHQLEGLSWLIALNHCNVNGILGDDMGLGKTLQMISYLAHLKESGSRGPFLVIGPLSIANNWKTEIESFCPSLKPILYMGNQAERIAKQEMIIDEVRNQPEDRQDDPEFTFDVLITTYDMILYDQDFLSRFNWKCMIIDEAHRLKNADSKLYTTLKESFQMPRIFLLTGTPVHNNLKELHALLHFIMPDIFSSEKKFVKWFPMKQIMSESTDNEKLKQLHQCLRPFLLRRKKAEIISELPSKSELILYTKLSLMQRKFYKAILMKDSKAIGKNNKKSLTNVLLNLRKCCNHPYLFDGAEPEPYSEGEHIINNCGKMVLLDKLLKKLKAEGHKVLLFSQMTSVLDILQDYLHYRQYTYERLDGSVRGEERFSAISNFSSESETFVFLLSTRAGGVGLNLVAADTVIFMDLDFNPQMDLQAQERIYRIGQKRDVTIYRLITEDTVEEVMLKRSFKKMALSLNAIEKGGFGSQSAKDDLTDNDLVSMIQYGLHKIVSDDNSDKIDFDAILQNMDIEEILNAKKVVSFGDMTNEAIGIEATDDASREEVYTYEGTNYDTKSKKTKKSTRKKKENPDEEYASDTSDNEDAAIFHSIVTADPEEDLDSDEEIVSPRKTRGYNLRKRKLAQQDDRPRKKQRRSSSYTSLAIVIPDDYEFKQEEEDIPDIDEISQGTLLNKDRKIEYLIGDATNPQAPDGPVLILNCLSDGGSWPRGGFCAAIDNNLSDAPKRNYGEASKNDDLCLGDAHMVQIDDDTYVVNLITQQYDEDTNTHGELQLSALEMALYKVQYAANNFGATVHMPRIGWGLPNFNWYGVERVIKKCLISGNVPTSVYYFKRGRNQPQQQQHQKPVKSKPNTTSSSNRTSVSSATLDKDLFEDCKFVLYNVQDEEQKQLKRKIIVNGGSVLSAPLHQQVDFIIFDDTEDPAEVKAKLGTNANDAKLQNKDWIDSCIKSQTLI